MYVCASFKCYNPRSQKRALSLLELHSLLGIVPESSARVASALNYRAISPVCLAFFFLILNNFNLFNEMNCKVFCGGQECG